MCMKCFTSCTQTGGIATNTHCQSVFWILPPASVIWSRNLLVLTNFVANGARYTWSRIENFGDNYSEIILPSYARRHANPPPPPPPNFVVGRISRTTEELCVGGGGYWLKGTGRQGVEAIMGKTLITTHRVVLWACRRKKKRRGKKFASIWNLPSANSKIE